VEIEISHEDEEENGENVPTIVAVVQIQRLLQETNDMLERLQSDFSLRHEINARRKNFESDEEDGVEHDSDDNVMKDQVS